MKTSEYTNKSQNQSYLELAQKIGQSVQRLQAGEPVRTTVQINSLDEFKELFAGDLTDAQRENHSKDLAIRHAVALAGSDPMSRFINYVSGNAPLSPEDAKTASTMFPLSVNVVSQADMPVTTNIVYGPSASPVLLNVGTLTFNGGSITTQNTVLTLRADAVAFGPKPGTLPYHIGITGVNGGSGTPGVPGAAPNPAQAASGSSVSPTSPGVCPSVTGGGGSNGATGNPGGPGHTGQNGLPSLPANITIGSFSTQAPGNLVLFTQSGAGGQGGVGGQGGAGQQGGNGGNGCDSGCEGSAGGYAGSGGYGGKGGDGGQGGNGVNGFNTTVNVPVANVGNVLTSTAVAPFGQGGLPGQGGAGGDPGSQGRGGKGYSNGAVGQKGNPGGGGTQGPVGTQQGSAGQFFINAN